MTRSVVPVVLMAVAALATVTAQPPAQSPPQAQTPVFSAGTFVVPVDVRVTDRRGRPITDLKASDFTIRENGVPQAITQFAAQSLEPEAPAPLTTGTRFLAAGAEPPRRRIFLIVLGRGRLQYPGKGPDGVIQFVREHLLPQDHVAVMAWDRATPFTTDHGRVLEVVERFKAHHEDIEMTLQSVQGGLAGVYGSRELPPSVRRQIDRVFTDADRATDDVLMATVMPTNPRDEAARIREMGDRLRDELMGSASSLGIVQQPTSVDVPFETYVEQTMQSMQDVNAIYRAIDYLKYLDGEKHILYVSAAGFTLPDADGDRSLAAAAADARVAINIVLTGGTKPSAFHWEASTATRVSRLTGGFFTSLSYAGQALARIDGMSRHSYLLGYTPINRAVDLQYRRVEVRVNRPGVNVYYRQGYFARTSRPAMNVEEVRSLTRISAATRVPTNVADLDLRDVFASPVTGANKAREVLVELRLFGTHMQFVDVAGRKTGKIDLAVFIADEQNLLVGQTWQTIDLTLEPPAHARLMNDGIPITLRVPIRRSSRNAKVILYDYHSDRLGTAHVRVKNK